MYDFEFMSLRILSISIRSSLLLFIFLGLRQIKVEICVVHFVFAALFFYFFFCFFEFLHFFFYIFKQIILCSYFSIDTSINLITNICTISILIIALSMIIVKGINPNLFYFLFFYLLFSILMSWTLLLIIAMQIQLVIPLYPNLSLNLPNLEMINFS